MSRFSLQQYKFSFFQSFSLHLSILALFLIGYLTTTTVEKPKKQLPEIIQASILDENKIKKEADRQKQLEISKLQKEQKRKQLLEEELKQEQLRINKLKQQSIAEERRAKQRKQEEIREEKRLADLKQKAEQAEKQAKLKKIAREKALKEEQKRKQAEAKAKEEKKRKEQAEAKARADEKKREAERQAEIQRKKAEQAAEAAKQQAEQARRKAAQDQAVMGTATKAIMRKVQNRWLRPSTSKSGLQATIQVKLLSSGEVIQAVVVKSSGDAVFDRSTENAVRKASPLPVPDDRDLFNRAFKSFTFIFKPQ